MHSDSRTHSFPPERQNHTLTRVRLERFTAFRHLDLELHAGINVFVGANGTGKTHLLQAAYVACECARMDHDTITEVRVHDKLVQVFLPSGGDVGRLLQHPRDGRVAVIEVWHGDRRLRIPVFDDVQQFDSIDDAGWSSDAIMSVFIPVKEMLSHGPGFRSLYAYREIQFEEIYADLIDRAYLPPLRGALDDARAGILEDLEMAIGGRVTVEDEEFFLKTADHMVEFTLLAEGMRKLGLLCLLVRNGTLPGGSVLFWDEPEANLNPQLFTVAIDVLLKLQRAGVQILMTTHDYAILKELELLMKKDDQVRFHALYRDADGDVQCESADRPFELRRSAIAEAFASLYDREIERSLGSL